MKQYQPSQFLEAAKLLANGNDPERLAEALASWARLVGFPHRADDDQDDRDMLLAARILEEKLPYYVQDHLGLPTRDYVDAILIALPELIEFLQAQVRPPQKGGRPPDSRRRLCAAVCAEAWDHYHGKIEPFSPKLQAACEAYWQCCGHPETSKTGRLKNWEEFLRWAKRESDEGFRENFLQRLNALALLGPNRFKSGSALVRWVTEHRVSLCIQDEFGRLISKFSKCVGTVH